MPGLGLEANFFTALASNVQALALRASLTIFGITVKHEKDNKIDNSY